MVGCGFQTYKFCLVDVFGIGTWYITEYDEETGQMFGLCDLGYPELGYVNLKELEALELPFGLKIERDMWWEPDKTLAEYAEVA